MTSTSPAELDHATSLCCFFGQRRANWFCLMQLGWVIHLSFFTSRRCACVCESDDMKCGWPTEEEEGDKVAGNVQRSVVLKAGSSLGDNFVGSLHKV